MNYLPRLVVRATATLLLVCAFVAMAALPAFAATNVRVPATGTATKTGGGATIDYSNCANGYVMVSYSGAASRIKVQVTRSGYTTYTYDLNTAGLYEVFPLTSGSGSYTVNVFENVHSNQYALVTGATIDVSLTNDRLPFLYPSQYVNFNSESAAVKKAAELAGTETDKLAIVSKVYNYVITNVTYDSAKAASAASGSVSNFIPNVDNTLSTKKGICFDYAALMSAMLRSQDIPTRLQVGYVSGGLYHAWLSVWTESTGWVNSIIYFDGTTWKLMDPTFAASSSQSQEIMQFIGDGTNYSVVYNY